MNSPTCPKCDCVKGCQVNPSPCPILLAECIASGQVSAAQIETHRVLDVAIAQPEQTAVFYQFQTKDGEWHGFSDEAHRKNTVEAGRWLIRALYTAPQVAQPEQTAATYASVLSWDKRVQAAHPKSEPEFWPDELRIKYMAVEISELRAAIAQPEQKADLAKVARDAITSLETIAKLAGVDDYMQTLAEVRGYANSRATAASQEIANIAQPEQKANFCFRCGKLVSAIHDIHTCTPPVGHTN